ncbi:MAG: hypothetical protein PF484_09110 [Bacteroidales bacterium]|jgi:hypothetical protein|nr:hypothetical protein [Bacteroidales bacterium]
MKKLSIFLLLIAFAFIGNAQTSKITGSWLMTKAETSEGIQEPYQITDFNEDGNMVMMGMDVGTWAYNKKNHSLVLKSDFDKDFNGEGKIEKITDKEMVITKDGVKMSYIKVDINQIEENNKMSGLFGSWELKNEPYPDVITYLTFTEPDEFMIIQKEEYRESRLSGTWMYNPNEKSLIMIGLRGDDILNGENKILNIDSEKLELDNKGRIFKANRMAASEINIERLIFTEGDFYNEDGDYKYYDDEEKLPWRNWSELKNGLLNVHQLVYKYFSLIDGTESFESKTLTSDVNASLEEEGFNIDYIFDGFDRYNLPEDAELRTNHEYSYPLYPLEEDTYRVVGQEQITTPAGTFDCTVLEAIYHYEIAKKLWMINDKIGVYAKIIEDKPGSFGKYVVYELQEIK